MWAGLLFPQTPFQEAIKLISLYFPAYWPPARHRETSRQASHGLWTNGERNRGRL